MMQFMKAQAQLPNSDLFFEQWNYNVNTHYWFYTPDTSGYSYQWFLDGIPTTTNDSIQISFPSTGYHLLKLEVNTGTTVRTSFRGIGVKPGLLFPGYISQSDWYFGRYVSLDFGSGSPLLTCASIDNSSTNTHEAIVTVSDNTGNAQFFMDGFSWYDIVNPGPGENHSLITANLGGAPVGPYVSWDFIDNQWDISNHSSQICIVPFPNHPNEYFLFITPQNQNIGNSPYTGLQVVHINNNGVPTFNLIPLGSINNYIQNRTSEYITSTPHCNGTDWWVVTNSQRAISSTNDYYVYRVSQFGITNGDGTLVNLPDIYFRTIAIGIFEFDTLDQQNLIYVAGQCALAYGNPVYMARTMLESLPGNWTFDDAPLCTQLGYARKAKPSPDYYKTMIESGFDFYAQPNPAETFTQLTIPVIDEASRLELFDLNGQLLKSVLIPAGTSVYNLNVSEFSAGLYALKLKSDKYQGVIKLLVK